MPESLTCYGPEDPSSISVIGVDLGGTNLRIAVADGLGRIRARQSFYLAAIREKGPDALSCFLRHQIWRMLTFDGRVSAVAIGVPGLVSSDGSSVYEMANLPELEGVNLRKALRLPAAVKTVIDNDLNMAALGELLAGSCIGSRNVVFIGAGTGLGLGIIINGKVYRGWMSAAGELGSTLVPDLQAKTQLPRLVKLESIASGRGIEQMWKNQNGDALSARDVFRLAQSGDSRAQEIIDRFLFHFRVALVNVVIVLSPEKVVLGGGTAASLLPYLDELQSFVNANTPKPPQLTLSSLGNDAGLVGAIQAALELAARLHQAAR